MYTLAINFYFKETSYKIVIVDNSGYDFSNDINNDRVESFSYISDSKDSAFGKGYGEAKLMLYALKHSLCLSSAEQIIKITGRHIIKNLNLLISHCPSKETVYADSDLDTTYAHSYIIVAPQLFYLNYLLNRHKEMYDSKGRHFEHVLAKAIKLWEGDGHPRKQFYYPVYIIGHPGSSSINYLKPSFKRYLLIRCKYYLYEISHLWR